MDTNRDAHAAVMDRGVSNESKTNNADHSQFNDPIKQSFADLRTRTLLAHALSRDTSEGTAAATGAQLILLWRQRGITAEEVTLGH
jgi:hypothetical protein